MFGTKGSALLFSVVVLSMCFTSFTAEVSDADGEWDPWGYYEIAETHDEGGNVSCMSSAKAGMQVSVVVIPLDGYRFSGYELNTASGEPVPSQSAYSAIFFTMPSEDVVLHIHFEETYALDDLSSLMKIVFPLLLVLVAALFLFRFMKGRRSGKV